MIRLPGITVLTQIYESANSLVYRGLREQDNQPVILKRLSGDYPPPTELIRCQQEYDIIRHLNREGVEGIIKAYALQNYQNTLVIVLEDFGGESLKILQEKQPFTLSQFLPIAIQITEILSQVHHVNIIHKDINPSNIVFNPQTGQAKLIDFGISTVLSRENPSLKNPNVLEGTLAYISPEQTGRMNRSLDYRSDFYSLGVTFYELLAKQLPFDTTDALELVHCHIAKQAVPPQEVNPEIPKAVSEIVMKLLAKTAEERYQSAWGIKADLEECLSQFQKSGKIAEFPLGSQDISNKFQIPQKLYGREQDVETLLGAFERVAGRRDIKALSREDEENIPPSPLPGLSTSSFSTPRSPTEMMLVGGYSGIGKSALVHEIYKPVTQKHGYFISGKFDQFQRNIPYSAVIQAFRELIRQLLTESEEQLQQWRETLLTTLGVNAQVIVDVIPEVELIIGKQPTVVELAPAESQNRFNLVFQNFIKALVSPSHPLVIFLDDLQWADSASLKLMQLLMTAAEPGLFLIGAYRDNEVNAAHPLMLTLKDIKDAGAIVNKISLKPLDLSTVNQLIADTLNCAGDRTFSLSELLLEKTEGNPFFLIEFLKALYTDKLLNFDYQQGGWQWKLEQIKERGITANVVELMANKIQKLPESTQQVLKLAACIGNQFDLETLAVVSKKLPRETAVNLHPAVVEGLLLPLNDGYKVIGNWRTGEIPLLHNEEEFSQLPILASPIPLEYKFIHDRIQQAAYSLISEDSKQLIHRQVGQLLLQNTPANQREEKIFDIVNQLNLGTKPIQGQPERDELARLNLIAGKKALSSVAYETAFRYLTFGVEYLNSDSWQTQYDLTLKLYVEAAEAAYLSTNFEQMERLAEVVLKQAKTLLDKVKVYEIKIQALIAQNKLLEAIKTGLHVFKLLGLNFPEKPTNLNIILTLAKTKLTLAGKRIEGLSDLPKMTDPSALAAMRLMWSISSAAYLALPELIPLLACKMVELSVKYGNAFESASGYAGYGTILCGVIGDIDSGYQFGKLALSLLNKFDAKKLQAKTFLVVHDLIKHWKEHLRETLQPLLDAYQSGLETGDLEFAALCANAHLYHAYFISKELGGLEQEMAIYRDAIAQLKQETTLHLLAIWWQTVLTLLDRSKNHCRLIGEAYNEEIMLPLHRKANDRTAIFLLYFNKLALSYLFAEYPQALENAAITEKYLDGGLGVITVPLFHFYESLTLLAVYPSAQKPAPNNILQKVRYNQKKMKKWAAHAPSNFMHKFYLVEAERCRVLDKDAKAMDLYDRAIALAQENDYIQEKALAYELAAKFYLLKRKDLIARTYMQEARYCYLKWGATRKVRHLDETYPQLLASAQSQVKDTKITSTSTAGSSGEVLDLATVMKANQAISGEIVLDKLLENLMKILIENTGAQTGFLILDHNEKLLIEASGSVDCDKVTVLQSIPISSHEAVSQTIINYVARTKENVVLQDATHEGKFINDLYIKENKPKSILCVPLINQGKLISIVYLENNLTTGAFTSERLEIVKLLSSQAAISIENAKLYSEVKESESRLTQFLEAVPVGVSVLDANGNPYYGNRIAKQLLGKGCTPETTAEQLLEVYEVYRAAGTERVYPMENLPGVRALMGESTRAEDIEIHQGDKIIPIETWGTPIYDEKGNINYAIVAFQDITERRESEVEREQFTLELFKLNKAFERFVPRQFLQFLDKKSIVDVQVGDQVQQEMSVLFSDIRDFTTLSESMTPQDNFKFINGYLSRMEPAIVEHQGFIDKYIGDAIMALFSGEADNAVKAGIDMLYRLAEYNQHRANSGYVPIQNGIGINTGSLMLGTVGGNNRMDGTVISDAVNLASRVESLTKNYGVSLLITHQTFSRLTNPENYAIRMIDRVKVKGKSELVTVYEVFEADLPAIKEGKLATLEIFQEALSNYNSQKFREAEQLFAECLRLNPMDRVTQIYLQHCQERV